MPGRLDPLRHVTLPWVVTQARALETRNVTVGSYCSLTCTLLEGFPMPQRQKPLRHVLVRLPWGGIAVLHVHSSRVSRSFKDSNP